jgi:ubiquinone/menaquinone biosynthesis C-methylase UbiE
MLNNQEFFDELSVQYDLMIPFEKAIERKKELFKNLLKDSKKTIADIGCGTGSDSLSLVGIGHKVTSFDPSAQMLNKARVNAKSSGLDLDSYQFGASEIPDDFNDKYNVVISFGNSFANIPTDEFESSVFKCYSLLREDGELYIQILNYEKILSEKKRIVNITTSDEKYFVRFYDFNENQIVFNILQFDKAKPADHKLISTKIYAYSTDDFTMALRKAGFRINKYYGSFNFLPFDPQTSNDLIITAVK